MGENNLLAVFIGLLLGVVVTLILLFIGLAIWDNVLVWIMSFSAGLGVFIYLMSLGKKPELDYHNNPCDSCIHASCNDCGTYLLGKKL